MIKLELKTLPVTVMLAAMLFFGNSVSMIQAQPNYGGGNGTPPGNVPPEQALGACQLAMGNFKQHDGGFVDIQLTSFRSFLATNFQNKSSTSSLLETAFARYREFRSALYTKYNSYMPQQGASQLTEGLGSNACFTAVQDALDAAQNELQQRAVQTSTVKKTTALISKYQQINAKLATLNRTFITMKTYLDTFAAKLPCYIVKGCNKG